MSRNPKWASALLLAATLALASCGDEGGNTSSNIHANDGDALCGDGGGDGGCSDVFSKADGVTDDGDGRSEGVDGASTPCDDQNSCTVDVLNADGSCSHTQKSDGDACDDGNKCTTGDLCVSGMCVGSGQTYCSDGNDCTTDVCDPLQAGDGCKHVNNLLPCDDGDACTTGDKCTAGACLPGTAKLCNDNNLCTTDSCDSAKGCVFKVIECNDQNPCTTDSCDMTSGKCSYVNNASSCEDGDMCHTGDKCQNGSCSAGTVAKDCDDANPCTKDSCSPDTGCKHASMAGTPCNDGDQTTKGDVCGADGVCAGIKPLTPCDDNNACTEDAGDPASGVKCTYIPVSCDDQNGCTKDTCDKLNGCVHTDNLSACNDGDACTLGDKCSSGVCVGGVAPVCDDNNPCTDDTCDPTKGCVYSPMAGAACDDGNFCTTNDQCGVSGICIGGPAMNCNDGNSCTADSCDKQAGGCVNLSTSGTVCNGNGICLAGSCKVSNPACADSDACTFDSGTPPANCTHVKIVCDDKNPCTDDSCDPTSGLCKFINNTAACDDGNACTVNDVCSAGTCASGTGLKCDDGDPCTTDACDKTGTCSHTTIVGCGFGEICGDGVDNDGDGKIDCQDSECGPDKPAIVIYVSAQYDGATVDFYTADKPNSAQNLPVPVAGKPYLLKCAEVSVSVSATFTTTSQLGGEINVWVQGASGNTTKEKIDSAPQYWAFLVWDTLPPKGPGVLTKSFPAKNGQPFKIYWKP